MIVTLRASPSLPPSIHFNDQPKPRREEKRRQEEKIDMADDREDVPRISVDSLADWERIKASYAQAAMGELEESYVLLVFLPLDFEVTEGGCG